MTKALIAINVIGGIAVLGSYALGIASNPATRGEVWGGVPEALRPLYTVNMLLAAAGYFLFSHYVVFRLDPARVRVASRFGPGVFPVLYALILAPSALWMPLTFEMLAAPSAALWIAIRLTLFAVGLGSLGLLFAIAGARPCPSVVGAPARAGRLRRVLPADRDPRCAGVARFLPVLSHAGGGRAPGRSNDARAPAA